MDENVAGFRTQDTRGLAIDFLIHFSLQKRVD